MSLLSTVKTDIANLRTLINKLAASDVAAAQTAIANVEKAVAAYRAIVIGAAVVGAVAGAIVRGFF